jgi:adenylate cyclase
VNPHNGRVLSFGSGALQEDGQHARAIAWAGRAEKLYPDDMSVIINIACLYARAGEKDRAMDLLDRVFSKGWGKKDWVENDPDYDNLRAEPRFIAMLSKLK